MGQEKDVERCMFCGSDDLMVVTETTFNPEGKDVPEYYVECEMCGARGPRSAVDEEFAILHWNKRSGRDV